MQVQTFLVSAIFLLLNEQNIVEHIQHVRLEEVHFWRVDPAKLSDLLVWVIDIIEKFGAEENRRQYNSMNRKNETL